MMTALPDVGYLHCDCSVTAVRYRTRSNGTGAYVIQCLSCGREVRAVSKQSNEVIRLTERIPFDEELKVAYQQRQRDLWAKREREREDERARKDTEWWRFYNAYLLTPTWRAKRAAVLDRAAGLCEGCRLNPATQAHHLTYDHVGNELLFELVAICGACHRRLHPEMDDEL